MALCRYGCRRRGPPTPGPACRQRGGLLIGGTVPFCPPAPARPISALACLVSWWYRSAFPSAVPHPFSCFRSVSVGGSVATWEQSAVRSFLPTRRAPPDQCFGVPGVPSVPCPYAHPCPPTRLVLSFGRVSAASRGRRGFRSPHEASSCAARNRNTGLLYLRPRGTSPPRLYVRSNIRFMYI